MIRVLLICFCPLFLFAFRAKRLPLKVDHSFLHTEEDSLKIEAFQILDTRCNTCHARKKPEYVFNPDNMESFAASIHIQVFVKKKMPKGRENKLNEKEQQVLKTWIEHTMK